LRVGLKLRYMRLLEFVGVPVVEGKMYSESVTPTCCRLWLLSASRAFSESSIRRPPQYVEAAGFCYCFGK
jgi:hypothetical protein